MPGASTGDAPELNRQTGRRPGLARTRDDTAKPDEIEQAFASFLSLGILVLDLEFNDSSLREPFDSANAEYIRRGIRERIRQSSVTVVYVSPHTAASRWVDWEIRESIRLRKGVVAVHKGEAPPASLPTAIRGFRIKVVPWNQKELSAAIDQAAAATRTR